MPSTSNSSSSSSSDQEINKKDEGSLISSVGLHHFEEENRSPDLELLYVHLGTDSEDEDEEGLREKEEEDASDNDKKTQNAHVENFLDKQKGDERTVDLEEGNNKDEEEDEEGEDYSDSEDFEDDSSDSMSSAEAREAAIRDGFLGFLYGYIQNDLFQKFLEKVANILDWILRKCGKNQDNEDMDIAPEDAVDEMGQEIMDNGMDDLVGSSARSLTNGSQTAGTGGSGGGGGGSGSGGGGE